MEDIINYFVNLFYAIRFKYFIKESKPSYLKRYDDMHLVFDFDFVADVHNIWNLFNKYYSKVAEHATIQPKLSCLEHKADCLRLISRLNTDVNDKRPFETGFLSTKGDFKQQYGLFELLCKVPVGGKLYWPAFWLYGDEWPPEIDIFEMMATSEIKSGKTKIISTTIHNGMSRTLFKTQKGRGLKGQQDLSAGYHKYSVLWNPYKIVWYFDDIAIYQLTRNIPSNSMHVVVSNGVGVTSKELKGKRGEFDIRRLRVFQYNK